MLLDGVLALLIAISTATDGWAWPVEGPRGVVRAFVGPPEPWRPGHRGVDIAVPGPELLAPADGVVRFAGWIVDRGALSIDHGGGVLSSFEPVEALVAAGDEVRRGDVIARIAGGHCTKPCVHVGLRVDGDYRNPLGLLGVGWPVLLPTRAT